MTIQSDRVRLTVREQMVAFDLEKRFFEERAPYDWGSDPTALWVRRRRLLDLTISQAWALLRLRVGRAGRRVARLFRPVES